MNELTPSERRALKARAHGLVPVILIGDKGLTGAVLAETERAIAVHELVKIRVQAERRDREGILREICAKTDSSAVQHIGKMLVVYRKKPPEPPQPKFRKPAERARPERKPAPRDEYAKARRPTTAARRMAKAAARDTRTAPTGTGRPGSRTASPRRAPARPPGPRRTSR